MAFDIITLIGFVAACLTTVAFLPQVFRVIKLRETKDLSLMMLIIFALGVSLWFVYGLLISDLPVIIANLVTLILVLTILCFKIKLG